MVVVPTTSIAAGLAAMIAFDADGDPEEVTDEMLGVARSLRLAEVTRAVREARVDGHEVGEGAYMGLVDGKLAAVGPDVEAVAVEVAEKLVAEGAEVLTLLRGEELDEAALARILGRVEALDDELEVEVHDGGQPMYPLQVAAE